MSRLVMWNLITLDGFFEGEKPWELAFHESVWGDELERLSIEQLDAADRLVFGRATYEGMAAYWKTERGEVAERMNRIAKVVCSRTLERADWENTRLVRDADAIGALKREGDGLSLVFGSADLSTTLIRLGLFDEYRLVVTPVILGKGRPLFGRERGPKLGLIEARPLASGGVIVRYEPLRG